MKRILLLLTVALSLLLPTSFPPTARAQEGEQTGDYSIKLRGTDGRNYDLTNMRGTILLVSFGATWCQPCKDELRVLEELKNEYRDKPVKFFWVSVEPEEEASDKQLMSFARSIKFTFPILRDTTRWTYAKFSTRQRIPLVVFFDQQGRFVAPAHAGMSTTDNYKRMVRGVLDRLLTPQGNSGAQVTGARSSN
jgi:thiol-disulfide isomerase/thioredoxin